MRLLRAALCFALPLLLSGCIFFEFEGRSRNAQRSEFSAGLRRWLRQCQCAAAIIAATRYATTIFTKKRPYRAGWGQGATAWNTRLNTPANPNNVGADGRILP